MDQAGTSLKPNILIAPLDWGLGHATRCIPLIKILIQQKCRVFIAGSGRVQALLKTEFPSLDFLELEGYKVTYSAKKWTFPFTLAAQIPQILTAIRDENEWLKATVIQHGIDGVISDNRFGLYHQEIPSVFITHQLLIKTFASNTFAGKRIDEQLQKINYQYINKFSQCWIPDNSNQQGLGGDLSHPEKMPEIPCRYLGPLTRFAYSEEKPGRKHLLIILSGPEPQRSILEKKLLEQLKDFELPVVFIRGLPGDTTQINAPSNVSVFNHVDAEVFNTMLLESYLVISRCGYSTVMDLAIIKKRSILIPTPGQTEQEYLATHLMKINFALCIDQDKFRLKNAIELSQHFPYQLEMELENSATSAIDQFVCSVKNHFRNPIIPG